MAESGIPSPWNIVKDAVTATTLIVCFAIVDRIKHRLFPGEAPLPLLVALNAADLTLACAFVIALVRTARSLWREVRGPRNRPGGRSGSFAQFVRAVKAGVWSAGNLGAVTALFTCLCLALMYGLAVLNSHTPTWVYVTLLVLPAVPIVVSLIVVAQEASGFGAAKSGAAFGVVLLFMAVVFGGIFELILLANRYLVSGSFDRVIRVLLLER